MKARFATLLLTIFSFGCCNKWDSWRDEMDEESLEIHRFALENGLWTPDPRILVGPHKESDSRMPSSPALLTEAFFVTPNNTHVTVQVGTTAMLRCRVHRLANTETVSWIRRRDHHLITLGTQTYSSDGRFQVSHSPVTYDWTLHIQYSQLRDSGTYECQISTHPPMGIITNLRVVQPVSLISGSPDIYAQKGSDVTLLCRLRNYTQPPTYVFWYHDDEMINYDNKREISVVNQGGESILSLRNVMPVSSGNYSCVPANAKPSSVTLHVILEKMPAAMQKAAARSGHSNIWTLVSFVVLVMEATGT